MSGRSGVTSPRGFLAAATAAGLKPKGRTDLALVASECPCTAAAVFTRNLFAAAPVVISRRHLRAARHRAVVINAGGANACTGPEGEADAEAVCRHAASALGCRPREILAASTGVIGVRLPVPRLADALPRAVLALSPAGGDDAARAILTTDTVAKTAQVEFAHRGRRFRVGGMAKGAGMIHPNLATMLTVITTDAPVANTDLQVLVRAACAGTFNAVSVDGQTSTNDSVFLLANGAAGGTRLARRTDLAALLDALVAVADDLAGRIVADGEGAGKTLSIRVTGARNDAEAETAARAVGDSLLVKTALHGGDANWGRILSAVGAARVQANGARLRVDVNHVPLVRRGVDAGTSVRRANRALAARHADLRVDLGTGGSGTYRYRTCDLTAEYVRINAAYRS